MNFNDLKSLLENESDLGYFFMEKGEYYKVHYYDVPTYNAGGVTLIDPRYYFKAKSPERHMSVRLRSPHKDYWDDIAKYLEILTEINKEEDVLPLARWMKRGIEQFYAEEEINELLEHEDQYFDFETCNAKLVIPIGSYAQKAAIAVTPATLKFVDKNPEFLCEIITCYNTRMSQGGDKIVSGLPLAVALSRKLRELLVLPPLQNLKELDLDLITELWYGEGNKVLSAPKSTP